MNQGKSRLIKVKGGEIWEDEDDDENEDEVGAFFMNPKSI
jgi:hypothetical protein